MQYNAIILDPPVPYERTAGQGVANKQYSLMTWDDLAALGTLLHAVAAPNCAIFLWICPPLLMETAAMVRAWNMRYITKAFCWTKIYDNGGFVCGLGSHTRANSEDVWLLSNGTPRRDNADVYQVVATLETETIIAPPGPHSRKPEEIQNRIERYSGGPYLEIFARRRRPGWTTIGNELDGLDIRESLARLAADAPLPMVARTTAEQHSFLEAA